MTTATTWPTGSTTSLGWTPLYRIEKGGDDITANFQDRATEIEIVSVAGGSTGDTAVITLDDRDWALASPISGGSGATTLQIFLGYSENGLYDQGTFQVNRTCYTYPPKGIRIECSAWGTDNTLKAPIITSYDGKTLGDIIGAIAAAGGVTPSISGDLASKTIQYLNQHQSSQHLLRELERRYDALAKFQDGYLSFVPYGSNLSATGDWMGGFYLAPSDVASFEIYEDERTSYTKTRASYFDKTNQKLTWLNSQVAGAPNASTPFMIKRAYNTQDEAQDAANAQQSQMNRGYHYGSVALAKGDPSIRGGQGFIMTGFRDGVDGSYTVKQVTHRYTKDAGITSSIEFEDAGIDFTSQISTT